jgi:hypothetical protein
MFQESATQIATHADVETEIRFRLNDIDVKHEYRGKSNPQPLHNRVGQSPFTRPAPTGIARHRRIHGGRIAIGARPVNKKVFIRLFVQNTTPCMPSKVAGTTSPSLPAVAQRAKEGPSLGHPVPSPRQSAILKTRISAR